MCSYVKRRRRNVGRCTDELSIVVVLIARQVFELCVATAHFPAQGPIGRIHLVPFLVNSESENGQTGISHFRYV